MTVKTRSISVCFFVGNNIYVKSEHGITRSWFTTMFKLLKQNKNKLLGKSPKMMLFVIC